MCARTQARTLTHSNSHIRPHVQTHAHTTASTHFLVRTIFFSLEQLKEWRKPQSCVSPNLYILCPSKETREIPNLYLPFFLLPTQDLRLHPLSSGQFKYRVWTGQFYLLDISTRKRSSLFQLKLASFIMIDQLNSLSLVTIDTVRLLLLVFFSSSFRMQSRTCIDCRPSSLPVVNFLPLQYPAVLFEILRNRKFVIGLIKASFLPFEVAGSADILVCRLWCVSTIKPSRKIIWMEVAKNGNEKICLIL